MFGFKLKSPKPSTDVCHCMNVPTWVRDATTYCAVCSGDSSALPDDPVRAIVGNESVATVWGSARVHRSFNLDVLDTESGFDTLDLFQISIGADNSGAEMSLGRLRQLTSFLRD